MEVYNIHIRKINDHGSLKASRREMAACHRQALPSREMAKHHVQIDCGELKMCAIDPEVIAIFFLKHYSQQFPTKAIKWNPKMHIIK